MLLGQGVRRGVKFYRQGEAVVAESTGVEPPVSLRARIGLNRDGDCRFVVGDEALTEWQFLQRALEPLFFGVDTRR